ncbi:DUF3995 domain-containing protein [Isoptericola sp. NEAU-Y5]|uniref:DUF3995 domain-containing protein n=1 Tax=Isoptericola luteus TaxID=2879484 RepID=A0ABS7ZF56_9MICO|nr:DUF3995 domain-containing protein [Isoptericola sp. NEAU-Y5]MCA5893678.1 DUF3995 domain-containing protein [Isoptericola sp. NEAU-Y5]
MSTAAAVPLIVIAVTHSVLGEHVIIRPLLAAPGWSVRLARPWADRLLRVIWHLLSVAWAGLAVLLLGASVPVVTGVVCLLTGAAIFACAPGHLSWPFFATAGLLALAAGGALPDAALWAGVVLAVVTALVAAGFHVAWAAGSRAGATRVLPTRRGTHEPTVRPPVVATLAAAVALSAYVGVVVALVLGAAGAGWRVLGVVVLVVLLARVVGDGRYVGILKRVRGTRFAHADDRWWTPAVGLLAAGAAASLALAA